jgi:hypothetical protein
LRKTRSYGQISVYKHGFQQLTAPQNKRISYTIVFVTSFFNERLKYYFFPGKTGASSNRHLASPPREAAPPEDDKGRLERRGFDPEDPEDPVPDNPSKLKEQK